MPSITGVRTRGPILNGLESLPASTEMLVVSSTGSVDSQAIPEATPSVDDYTALLASTEDSVLVTDSLTGGFFVLSADQSTAQNGGTRIRRSDNSYVDRIWDGKNVRHDWFAGFGVDPADQITNAVQAAGPNCVVTGSPLTTGRRVYITQPGVTIDGINLTRANQVSSTLTVAAPLGVTQITVANGSVFRVLDLVIVSNPTLPFGGIAQNEGSGGFLITAINGNVLTLGGALNAGSGNPTTTYPIGSTVVRVHDLINFEASAHRFTVRNCVFNGNAGNITLRGWASQASISISASLVGGLIENCDFHNTPAENIVGPNGLTIRHCRGGLAVTGGLALQGSFYHVSDVTSATTELYNSTIENCFVDTCCQVQPVNQHCEGAITYSSNVRGPKIVNCRFRNGGTGILSGFGGSPTQARGGEVINSEFENFDNITTGSLSGSTILIDSKIRWIGTKFINCGYMVFQGNNVARGQAFRDIEITDCVFRGNSRLAFRNCADIRISNVQIEYDPATTFTVGVTGAANQWDCGALCFLQFDRLKIRNLRIVMPASYSAGLVMACNLDLQAAERRRDAAGTLLNVLYPQSVDIDGVEIHGGRHGFTAWRNNNALGQDYPVADWRINNVKVYGPDLTHTPSGTAGAGIIVPAGSLCSNLDVRSRYVNLSWIPIIAGGIRTTSPALATSMGAVVRGWSILGLQGVNQICNFSAGQFGAVSGEHVVATNGITNSNLAMQLGTNTQVDAPITISLATLTAFAGEINHGLFENSGVY